MQKAAGARALHYDHDNDHSQREQEIGEDRRPRRLPRQDLLLRWFVLVCVTIITTVRERPAMTTITGDTMALGEGSHYDTTTRKAAMVTTMQDRLQERLDKIRTSSDYIIRLTDSLRSKFLAFLSHVCTPRAVVFCETFRTTILRSSPPLTLRSSPPLTLRNSHP